MNRHSVPESGGATGGLERKQTRKAGFKRLNNILNRVLSTLGLDRRLKQHTLMSLWPHLMGEPWAHKSRCLFIDNQDALVVAVADAACAQELILLKPQILAKLRPAANAVGVSISNLRFDLKHFHQAQEQELECKDFEPAAKQASKDELSRVTLSDEDQEQLQLLAQQLAMDGKQVKQDYGGVSLPRILHLFEQELKLRAWRRLNGYPICSLCQHPVAMLWGNESLCAPCYFAS